MVKNMKLALTNVPFRHNTACFIQNWSRFKRAITVYVMRCAIWYQTLKNGVRMVGLNAVLTN